MANIIKASELYAELKESIASGDNPESTKFVVLDYLYQRAIDEAAGYENIAERNRNLLSQLGKEIQETIEKYNDYSIDFDDAAHAIKIAGTRNNNLEKAKADFAEQVENRKYLRESEIIDDGIEQVQTNGGISESAMEAEIATEENAHDVLEEEEDYDDGQIPLEVTDRTETYYTDNSDKLIGIFYTIRIDDGLKDTIAPSLRELKENEHLFIECRWWENGEENDFDFSAFIMRQNEDGSYSRPNDLNTRFNQTRIHFITDSAETRAFKETVRDFVRNYEGERRVAEENLSPFEYDGLTYIPVRTLSEHEKALVHDRSPKEFWNNAIIERPKNGEGYSADDFRQKSGKQNIDLFYCIERGKFFTPVENGIINLNEGAIDEHFRDELNDFYRSEQVQKIIKSNRPLTFDAEKDITLMQNISSVLTESEVFLQKNKTIGDVRVKLGTSEHGGLSHIIKRRMDKMLEHEGMDSESAQKETAAILFMAVKNIAEAPATKETNERYAIYKDGIKTCIGKDKNGRYIVSGFDFDDTKQEAADAIKSVNAQYGYAPEFLEIYAQVGAAYASLNNTIPQQIPVVNKSANETLEERTLNEAADLLKNMQFTPENYKKLLNVINEISDMNGLKNLEVPKEEEIVQNAGTDSRKSVNAQTGYKPESLGIYAQAGAAPADKTLAQNAAPVKDAISENQKISETKTVPAVTPFDPETKIVYGETKLPVFVALVDGKLQSVENAVVMGFDKSKQRYTIESDGEKIELPKATFETLLKDKREMEEKQARLAEGRTIVFKDEARGVQGTLIPEFAMYTAKGLESFKDFVATKFNHAENSYTLTNGDTTMTVTADRFKEITAPERFENHFDEESPAWKKLCERQYKDFFEPRANTAYNFRHNLAVYCRKEANSPCDALHLAKDIIQRMPKEEQKKTELLLKKMTHENESTNELVARLYHEAIKEMPLNEDYMKAYQPKSVIVRPFYDTISGEGQKVDNDPSLVKGGNDRNLKIGDTLRNVDIQTAKLFGKGTDSIHFDSLKVVSASKEGNSITLMDGNKSFFKLPRDTVLAFHKEHQQREMKQEQRHERRNTMTVGYV
ncbi:MAG: hypothetical protein IJR39_04355 [Treponema sp.]|nr:hypothetical protein [Treponema sp.]